MQQFVPTVSDLDVERVVARDWPSDQQASILVKIRSISVREKPRVILACLKNAHGDRTKLENELNSSAGYWREIIGKAEYPHYSRKSSRIENLAKDEVEQLIERDKRQYLGWLSGESSGRDA